jgi:hypothetical protein
MNDAPAKEFFINLYMISHSTRLGWVCFYLSEYRLKNKALETGRRSMDGCATKGSSTTQFPGVKERRRLA